MLTKSLKQQLIKQHGKSPNDTGSIEIQVSVLSERINQISNHLKTFSKDEHSRLGLLKMVGKRRRFMRYLKKHNPASHDVLMSNMKKKK